jgi:hypothetical protein
MNTHQNSKTSQKIIWHMSFTSCGEKVLPNHEAAEAYLNFLWYYPDNRPSVQ